MAGVEIRVLGPLTVRLVPGVRLPAGRVRTVLVVLALHCDEAVPWERLIEAAWGNRPPVTALTQLQGMVSALRRALPPGAIETDGSAYRLRAGPVRVDLTEAQAAIDAARVAARANRLGEAAAGYRNALTAWHGMAFDGLDSAYLAGHAARLTELRNVVVEEWARVELALGRYGPVIDELTGRLAADPLRESATALLMTALYRAGRQADALAVFRATRTALRDALGVEPGPDLQDLHRRMLATDRTLLPAPPQGPDAASAPDLRPAQLPPDTVDFTGRGDHVKHLVDALGGAGERPGAAPIALVTGIGGVGKTTLAVHVAHRLRPRFPDGQVHLELRGGTGQPVSAAQAAGRVLRDLGVADRRVPAGEDERFAMYRSVLADRRLLIVLDGAADAAHVRPLLPAGGAGAVLVTSRHRMPGLAATRVQLEAFEPGEAAALFTRIVGADRTSAEPGAVADLLAACGYLPLAVRVAGARLAVRPMWAVRHLADRLAGTGRRLDELAVDDQQARATFEVSYRGLRADQARAFRLLAVAELDEIPAGAAAALLGLDRSTAERLAETLADMNLLHPVGAGRYRYHDLLRLYAREQAEGSESPAERAAGLGRLLAWYHGRTRAATRAARPGELPETKATGVTEPFPDATEAKEWLDREHRNIALALLQAAREAAPDAEGIAGTLRHVRWYLRTRGHRHEWTQLADAALDAATRAGSPAAELIARVSLGQLAMFRGDTDVARDQIDQVLRLAGTVGDRATEAYAHHQGGALAHQQDRMRDSIAHHERALAIYTELDDLQGRFIALVNVAMGHRVLHESRRALEVLDNVVPLVQRLATPESRAMLLHQMACCQADLGDLDEAVATHEECLALVRRLGQREGEAYTLAELGGTHLAAHRPAAAATHLRQAIDLFRTLADANATNHYLVELGHAHRTAGRPDAARAAWTEALDHFAPRDTARADQIRTLLAG
jgi:DNA-binding SARP family transcriptional activator